MPSPDRAAAEHGRADRSTKIAGTDRPAQAVADAAAGAAAQRRARGRSSVPLPERAFDAPDRALPRLQRAPGGRDGRRRCAALARALRGGDRAAARRAWTAAYARYLRIGAAYGALGDLDAAIVADRERIERGLWTGEPLSALRARGGAARRRDVARAAPHRPAGRDHPAGLRDPRRTRSSRTPSATCSAASPRPTAGRACCATAASLAATDAVVGTLRPLLAERGALAPIETGLLRLRRELAAIRRAHGGAGRRSTRSPPPSASG